MDRTYKLEPRNMKYYRKRKSENTVTVHNKPLYRIIFCAMCMSTYFTNIFHLDDFIHRNVKCERKSHIDSHRVYRNTRSTRSQKRGRRLDKNHVLSVEKPSIFSISTLF